MEHDYFRIMIICAIYLHQYYIVRLRGSSVERRYIAEERAQAKVKSI